MLGAVGALVVGAGAGGAGELLAGDASNEGRAKRRQRLARVAGEPTGAGAEGKGSRRRARTSTTPT